MFTAYSFRSCFCFVFYNCIVQINIIKTGMFVAAISMETHALTLVHKKIPDRQIVLWVWNFDVRWLKRDTDFMNC